MQCARFMEDVTCSREKGGEEAGCESQRTDPWSSCQFLPGGKVMRCCSCLACIVENLLFPFFFSSWHWAKRRVNKAGAILPSADTAAFTSPALAFLVGSKQQELLIHHPIHGLS